MTDTEAVLALIAAWVLTTDADAVAVFATSDADTLWAGIEQMAQCTLHTRRGCMRLEADDAWATVRRSHSRV